MPSTGQKKKKTDHPLAWACGGVFPAQKPRCKDTLEIASDIGFVDNRREIEVVRVAEIKQLLGFLCRMSRIRFHWLNKHLINAATIHIHYFKVIAAPLKIFASLRNTPQLQQHKTG